MGIGTLSGANQRHLARLMAPIYMKNPLWEGPLRGMNLGSAKTTPRIVGGRFLLHCDYRLDATVLRKLRQQKQKLLTQMFPLAIDLEADFQSRGEHASWFNLANSIDTFSEIDFAVSYLSDRGRREVRVQLWVDLGGETAPDIDKWRPQRDLVDAMITLSPELQVFEGPGRVMRMYRDGAIGKGPQRPSVRDELSTVWDAVMECDSWFSVTVAIILSFINAILPRMVRHVLRRFVMAFAAFVLFQLERLDWKIGDHVAESWC